MVRKTVQIIGCGVVIEDICTVIGSTLLAAFSHAEAVAIYRALQLIDPLCPVNTCIYTDSMSVLEALENYRDRRIQWYVRYSTLRVDSTAKGFRYRVLLATQVT
ncbi:hypothetical protein TNCV_2717121 [Trichonephila clavipes]|nr:hypothetical protein TNCV_2717121 [Trichonephila clavipes]